MIETIGLTRRFGDKLAVDDVTLRVPDGAILALLGPNGAGKTTTVRMLAGLLAPSAGDATVAGYDVRRDPAAVRARTGLVTDAPGLYPQMTLPDYLEFFGGIYGLEPAYRRRRIDELIAFFGLGDFRRQRMVGFSKGMKQKVALARALLHDPVALFLDEPTSGLDPLTARAVRDLILDLKHARRSIILCTHDLDEAERLSDEIAILRRGRLVARGAPAALRAAASPDTLVRITFAAPFAPAAGMVARHAEATALAVAEDGSLSYRTRRPEALNPAIIGELVSAGARIVSVSCETRTLEDVYADMLGDETERGAAEPAPELVPVGGR